MRCLYCHNPDTWEPNKGTQMTVDEVLEGFYSNMPFYHNGGVTVTGGEPMMQMDFSLNYLPNFTKMEFTLVLILPALCFNQIMRHL